MRALARPHPWRACSLTLNSENDDRNNGRLGYRARGPSELTLPIGAVAVAVSSRLARSSHCRAPDASPPVQRFDFRFVIFLALGRDGRISVVFKNFGRNLTKF